MCAWLVYSVLHGYVMCLVRTVAPEVRGMQSDNCAAPGVTGWRRGQTFPRGSRLFSGWRLLKAVMEVYLAFDIVPLIIPYFIPRRVLCVMGHCP